MIDFAAIAAIFVLVICFAFANQAALRKSIKPVPKPPEPRPRMTYKPIYVHANSIQDCTISTVSYIGRYQPSLQGRLDYE